MALFLTKDLDDPARSRIGVWQISESEAELRAMTSIPSDELEEISYIRSESLRKQKLAVRALLDAMFEEKVYLSHHVVKVNTHMRETFGQTFCYLYHPFIV